MSPFPYLLCLFFLAAQTLGLMPLANIAGKTSNATASTNATSTGADAGGSGGDFYNPPAGFANTKPGTVLKSRLINPAILGGSYKPVKFKTYQLLFRTTSVNGSAIATATTVFIPDGAFKDRMIAFDVFEDSAAPQCSPSLNMLEKEYKGTNYLVQQGANLMELYLLKRYVVSIADDEGPDNAFGAGRLAGMILLDSIRATKSFAAAGLTSTAMLFGTGYSGGSIATGWAASIKATYAPELNVVGWAMGGNPANLTGSFEQLDGQFAAGLIPAVMLGLSMPSAYPQLQPIINKIATPEGKAALDFARVHCGNALMKKFLYKKFLSPTFTTLGTNLLYDPEIVKILNNNLMGGVPSETPKVPVFLYHSTQDHVMPIRDNLSLRNRWCANGGIVQFNTYSDSGHGTLAVRAIKDVFAFMDAAFNKTSITSCTSKVVQPTFLSKAAGVEPKVIGLLNGIHNAISKDKLPTTRPGDSTAPVPAGNTGTAASSDPSAAGGSASAQDSFEPASGGSISPKGGSTDALPNANTRTSPTAGGTNAAAAGAQALPTAGGQSLTAASGQAGTFAAGGQAAPATDATSAAGTAGTANTAAT